MSANVFNPCPEPNPHSKPKDPNIDPPYPACDKPPQIPTQKDPYIFSNKLNDKYHLGSGQLCDPMQTGYIVEDQRKDSKPKVIYQYTKALRGADEAMKDLFSEIVVIDELGEAHPVPIQWASQERAVAAFIQANFRKDNSLAVDRIQLPMLAIYASDYTINQQRYVYHNARQYFQRNYADGSIGKPGLTIQEDRHPRDTVFGIARGIPMDIGYQLTIWTIYWEDMNQILEQIILKFSPVAYIRIQGVHWETAVKIQSIANNVDMEPGDQAIRVFKFQINMTAETFIPQPILKQKAVLKTKVDMVETTTDEEITRVLARIEEAVEGV